MWNVHPMRRLYTRFFVSPVFAHDLPLPGARSLHSLCLQKSSAHRLVLSVGNVVVVLRLPVEPQPAHPAVPVFRNHRFHGPCVVPAQKSSVFCGRMKITPSASASMSLPPFQVR